MQPYEWIRIEELPVEKRKYRLKILVCDATAETLMDYNFPEVVMWNDNHWILTWNHQEYTKPITHYLPIFLTNGKLAV
jgi:hypothetical protein